MASIKAVLYEKELLKHVGELKRLTLQHVRDSADVRQEFFTEVNELFEIAHEQGRKHRKALSFLHTANESYKQQLRANNIEPNEFYGREKPQWQEPQDQSSTSR